MSTEYNDIPRAFKSSEVALARREMLQEAHISPLTAYVENLRIKYPDWEFPDFDPMDGGIHADMLFLLEKPGPMTSPNSNRKGSGFISRNNDDATAEAVFTFMQQAEIDRKRVVLWNVIPGWNGTIKVKSSERNAGVAELGNLLKLLPKIKAVVLVGSNAHKAEISLKPTEIKIFKSAHPSPKVRNMSREKWDKIPKQWAEAALALGRL
ncbi:Uracil DNA glycosylase superfamily protein [compost metagenome]